METKTFQLEPDVKSGDPRYSGDADVLWLVGIDGLKLHVFLKNLFALDLQREDDLVGQNTACWKESKSPSPSKFWLNIQTSL